MEIVFIPENLDMQEIIKSNPPAFEADIECFYYIIGLVVDRMAYRKDNVDDKSDYSPINAQLLQRRIRKYNLYLKYLISHGILQRHNQYIPGVKSRGYKIADEYLQQDFRQERLTRKGLIKTFDTQRERKRRVDREYGYLTKWFNSNLQIDYHGAKQHLDILYEEDIKTMDVKNAARRLHLRKIGLEKLRSGLFSYDVDDTGHRFHSNLTTLKSELRNFITYACQRLCSVDIKNSQPFISTIFFNPAFYSEEPGNVSLFSLNPSLFKSIKPQINKIRNILSSISNIIMLVKDTEAECRNDLELYCTLVDKGRIYRYFADELYKATGVFYDLNVPREKRKLKDEFFLMLYSDNRFIYYEKGYQKRVFKRLFRTVHRIFNLIKQQDKTVLPILLQQVESEVVLKRVCRRLSGLYPELPIFTIHDSIVTLESHKWIVRDTLKMEFENTTGLQPSLAFEVLSPARKITTGP